MKKELLRIHFAALILIGCSCGTAKNETESLTTLPINYINCSIGASSMNKDSLTITKDSLDYRMTLYHKKLQGNEELSDTELLDLIRVYNTVTQFEYILNEERNKEFLKLSRDYLTYDKISPLGFKISRGMCYYSKEYNLYFGGVPHQNSHYKIIE